MTVSASSLLISPLIRIRLGIPFCNLGIAGEINVNPGVWLT